MSGLKALFQLLLEFLNLFDKHFPKNHTFHSICSRNNVKVSYNTCGSSINIKKVITTHNKTILDNSKKLNKTKCKRVNKNTFPLNREYQVENIIYQASLNSNNPYFDEKYDKGSCETTFKKWFTNHKKSFENKQYKNETELSNEVWNLKSTNNNAEIAWKFYEDGPL